MTSDTHPMAAFLAMQTQMMAGMATAITMAMTSAMAVWSRPFLTAGDVTIYFPFGQGYSQDIDPNTNWIFARAGQSLAAGSPERLASAYAQQQELISELLIGLSQGPDAMDRGKVDQLRQVVGDISSLKK